MSTPACRARAVCWLPQQLLEVKVSRPPAPATGNATPAGPRRATATGAGLGHLDGSIELAIPRLRSGRTSRASGAAPAQRAGLVALVQEAHVNGRRQGRRTSPRPNKTSSHSLRPLELVEAHHRTGQQDEREPPPRIPVPAHLQPPPIAQPRQRVGSDRGAVPPFRAVRFPGPHRRTGRASSRMSRVPWNFGGGPDDHQAASTSS
jgi:hypothetical protein